MKKLILILLIAFVAFASQAQRGVVVILQTDTLKGVTGNPKSSPTITLSGTYESLCIQGLFTQLGGTSDGNTAVYGSVDGTSWSLLNGVGGMVIAGPKASTTGTDLNQLTITNAMVANWTILKPACKYYKVVSNGTSADTTKVVFKYVYK